MEEKRVKKKELCISVFLILTLLLCFTTASREKTYTDKVYATRKILCDKKYIIHAGGYIEGACGTIYSYTNSKDALINSCKNGNSVVEIDFMLSKDGKVICAHDGVETWAVGINVIEPITLAEFKEKKVFDEFETMALDDLAKVMYEYEGLYIVTDVKDDNVGICKLIKDFYPDLQDRFIIQIYHKEEYTPIYDLGFHNIIYTLYKSNSEELRTDVLKDFAEKHELVAFTFWESYLEYTYFWEAMKETKVPIFVHTVNDENRIRDCLNLGANGVYTDLVTHK